MVCISQLCSELWEKRIQGLLLPYAYEFYVMTPPMDSVDLVPVCSWVSKGRQTVPWNMQVCYAIAQMKA